MLINYNLKLLRGKSLINLIGLYRSYVIGHFEELDTLFWLWLELESLLSLSEEEELLIF